MQPSYAAVLSSTALGAGCGTLAVMGVFGATGLIPAAGGLGAAGFAVALVLLTVGRRAARDHPGHPPGTRAALADWRTSWRSREAVFALATYVPVAIYATGWLLFGTTAGSWGFFGVVTALFATLAVHASGMVYATQNTVPAWHNTWTVPLHLSLALHTGALIVNALVHLFGAADPQIALLAVIAMFLAFYLKRRHWRFVDAVQGTFAAAVESDPAKDGAALPAEQVRQRRRTAFLCLILFPGILTLMGMEASRGVAIACAVLAMLSAAFGVVAERWLFFAEARRFDPAGGGAGET